MPFLYNPCDERFQKENSEINNSMSENFRYYYYYFKDPQVLSVRRSQVQQSNVEPLVSRKTLQNSENKTAVYEKDNNI